MPPRPRAVPQQFPESLTTFSMGTGAKSVGIGHYLGRWSNSNDGFIAIVSCIIVNAARRDDRWLALVMDQLGVSERVLRLYLSNGNSVLLANLIHAIHPNIYFDYPLSHILPSLCKFNVEHTLPDLQHQFCDLSSWKRGIARPQRSFPYPRTHSSYLSRITPRHRRCSCHVLQSLRHFCVSIL